MDVVLRRYGLTSTIPSGGHPTLTLTGGTYVFSVKDNITKAQAERYPEIHLAIGMRYVVFRDEDGKKKVVLVNMLDRGR